MMISYTADVINKIITCSNHIIAATRTLCAKQQTLTPSTWPEYNIK